MQVCVPNNLLPPSEPSSFLHQIWAILLCLGMKLANNFIQLYHKPKIKSGYITENSELTAAQIWHSLQIC